ncbi:MAG TPA: restriction endonuclease [Burkholderiaceae bacterium]|nr:restriction endonuclease [Burkholderiaceae bacterium]
MRPDLARMLSNIPLFSALRRTLPAKGAASAGTGSIEEIGWNEFEQLVIEGFQRRGYHTAGGTKAASNGGDLLLRRDRETYLVYCKAWRSKKVGLGAVKAMHESMRARGANGGFLLSFGRVGRDAARYAGGEKMQMLDGPALKALIEPVRQSRAAAPAAAPAKTAASANRSVPESPACPLCGKAMRMRTAKRGSRAGHGFWGCIDHPYCKGLRALV